MGKKSTKVLSGALATTSLLGGVMGAVPVFAATNLDAMYKSAFDAVMKAKEDESQESITAARKAIDELRKHKELQGFVGEFSKQADKVQQKLFDDFYSLLFVDGKKKDKIPQKDINKAREFVKSFDSFEGNKQYTASWSTAVDDFQKVLIKEAHDAVVKAMTSKDEKDLKAAEELLKELATSTNEDTKKEAERFAAITVELQKEIQEEAAKLKVASVSAINKTSVTVNITALTEAKTGATVKVTDNNGNVKAVKPLDLVKGETVAKFTFVDPLGSDPKGVWTVEGKTIDLDLQAKLDDVYDATNQVKLLEALKALGLENVKDANIAFYQTALGDIKADVAKADFTKANAQTVITEGNKAAMTGAETKALVKAVEDASNQVELLNALQNDVFERVNADWIAEYWTVLSGDTFTNYDADDIKAIQTKINSSNATKLSTGATSPVGKLKLDGTNDSIVRKDLEEAKALVSAYMVPDKAGEDAKAELLRKIDVQLAIVKVLEATTPAQLSSAMNALKAVDAAYVLNMDNFKDANRAEYIKAFALAADTAKNSIFDINGLLVSTNTAQAKTEPQAVKDAGSFAKTATPTATQKSDLLKALQKYTDLKNVTEANAEEYAKLQGSTNNKFGEATVTGNATTDKSTFQALVDEANMNAIAAQATAGDSTKLYAALVAYGNDIKGLNVNNKAEYLAAAIFEGTNNKEVTAYGSALSTTEGFADLVGGTNDEKDVQALVTIGNIDALNNQSTATGVLAKLSILPGLKNVNPEFASEYLKSVNGGSTAATIEIKDLDGSTDTAAGNARTVANVQTAIDEINAAQAATANLKALNDATTVSAVEKALTSIALKNTSDFTKYINLKAEDKSVVAKIFLDNDLLADVKGSARAEALGKYTTVANIKADVETAVATKVETQIDDINKLFVSGGTQQTPTTLGAQTELANLVDYGYDKYDNLTPSEKLAAAEAFLAAYPKNDKGEYVANSYKTLTQIFSAVDAAIVAK